MNDRYLVMTRLLYKEKTERHPFLHLKKAVTQLQLLFYSCMV